MMPHGTRGPVTLLHQKGAYIGASYEDPGRLVTAFQKLAHPYTHPVDGMRVLAVPAKIADPYTHLVSEPGSATRK
jgi:hypothetical protein